jgi:hypothetical protein
MEKRIEASSVIMLVVGLCFLYVYGNPDKERENKLY